MSWKVTQLSGNGCDSPRGPNHTPTKEDEISLNARQENPDDVFEILPRLLIDRSDNSTETARPRKLTDKVFLATTTFGNSNTLVGHNELVGVAFNKTFLVLSKELDVVEKSIELDASIDFILWRKSVLLLGLSSSEIILLHPVTLEQTASRKVCPSASDNECDQPFFHNAFIHPTKNPTRIDLIAVGVNGDVYSFPNVSLAEDGLDFTQDDSMISINIDVGAIKGTIQGSNLSSDAKVVAAWSPSLDTMITGEESGTISYFGLEIDENENDENSKAWKVSQYKDLLRSLHCWSENVVEDLQSSEKVNIVKLVQCQRELFILFSNGELHYVVNDMMLITQQMRLLPPDYFIHDFAFVIRQSRSVKLWIIYSDKTDHHIAIYPDGGFGKREFTTRIPSASLPSTSSFRFPIQASFLDEPTAFIEIFENGSTKVYNMREVSTDLTLQNLLDKGRFAKAELLAVKYSKNLDLVWKAKAEAQANELSILYQQQHKNCQKVFDEMLKTLALVRESDWICGFIVKGRRGLKLEWVKDLLSLGLKRVSECSSSANGQRVLRTRKKFYTFEQVLPNGSINQWNDFNDEKNTMLAQCIWFLENDEFQKCEVIWQRHSDEFISAVGISDLTRFFTVLFEAQLKSEEAISLFKTIFPCAIDKCEEEDNEAIVAAKINGLILLVRSQLRSLEREKTWPAEAISFMNILITAVSDEIKSLESEKEFGNSHPDRLERKSSICSGILVKSQSLLQALTELSLLKQNHSIRVPFDTYTNDDIIEVVNSMLDELMRRDEIEIFINEFLRPFVLRNNLDMNHLFTEHVKSAVEVVPYYMCASDIPFEERLITLVSHVTSIKCKLECVHIMAEHWPVPWLPMFDDMVKGAIHLNALSCGDEGCVELQEQIKWLRVQVPYRCLQKKYRLMPHKLASGFGVQMALLRILTQKETNYFEDCLELIKHTGKYTETGVRTLKAWLELSTSDMPIEEIIPNDLTDLTDRSLLRDMLDRLLVEFRTGKDSCYEEKDWKRFSDCAHLIANRINDSKALEFLNLRQLIPNLWNDDILESSTYPFCALELLLQSAHMKTSNEIIQDCNRLSVVSFTNYKNLIVLAAAFFILPGPGSAFQKMWDLIEYVIQTEEDLQDAEGGIVSKAGLSVVHEMALHIPSLSTHQLEVFHAFCRLLAKSFGEGTTEPIAKLFGILRIFETLREHEIPLEKDFMSIYKGVWREGVQKTPVFLNDLTKLGEAILRFGNKELFGQLCNAVHLELVSQVKNRFGTGKQILLDTANKVSSLKNDLLNRASSFVEKETNPRVISLVKSLDEAGFSMNSYSLRHRSKGKLISKLLDMGFFQLAAQIALVFDYKNAESWSNILQQYMSKGSTSDLKTVLEALKKIADLWVIQEFSAAWLKVSQEYPGFRHVCPIPLD